jgi:hypothetical protein
MYGVCVSLYVVVIYFLLCMFCLISLNKMLIFLYYSLLGAFASISSYLWNVVTIFLTAQPSKYSSFVYLLAEYRLLIMSIV